MRILRRTIVLLLVFFSFTTFVIAQRRRGAAPKTAAPVPTQQPAPTFDTLLATDSYRIYVEIRNVGQLLKTPSFNDVVEPIVKVASPPKEFKTLLSWLNSQSDSLITSRMLVASWSSRPLIPNVLLAIEFSSPEEAQKFEPRLKNLMPKLFPAPTPVPEGSPRTSVSSEKRPAGDPEPKEDKTPKEVAPSFVIKQAGSLVFVSDKNFTFKNLRPAGSKVLTEDPNFRRVHDRFSTESILVYVDTAAMGREEQERRQKAEEENQKRAEAAEAYPTPSEGEEASAEMADAELPTIEPPPISSDPDAAPETPSEALPQPTVLSAEDPQPPPTPNIGNELIGRLGGFLFTGRPDWPDGLGVALAFEPDNYALRVLLVNEPNAKVSPIPFMPQLVSGPAMTPESPAVFPSNTELFVAVSLDYSQIYDGLNKAITEQSSRAVMSPVAAVEPEESPFVLYEKKSGIKLKDDLIPLLGNEVALMLPLQTIGVAPSQPIAEPASTEADGASETKKSALNAAPNPVVAIAIRDRERLRALIPKVIDSFGFKGASLLAQSEKQGDTEIVSYGDALSYAFIGNFILVSPGRKELQQVVEAYLNHDTLASESHFRNSTRWQPRQVLGQFYLSPKLMDSYRDATRTMDATITDQLADFLSRLTSASEPLTYALSNEGSGPLHEVRIPKNLALLTLASVFGIPNQVASATANEVMAQQMLRTVASAEATFRATDKDGNYGSIDQLVAGGLIAKHALEKNGYRIELNVLGARFDATAVPLEYGKTGKLSFFVDESNVLRSGDHGGGPATVADKPVK